VYADFCWHCAEDEHREMRSVAEELRQRLSLGWRHLYWEMSVPLCWYSAALLATLKHGQYSEYDTVVFLSQQRLLL